MARSPTHDPTEGAGVLRNDLPLVLDELSVANPYDVDRIVYTLASGVGKGRAAKDGSLRESHKWRTLILSTGEMRVTDKISEVKRRAPDTRHSGRRWQRIRRLRSRRP